MTMPDQSHINQVRDALWRWPIGGASVMVGSGFSKNADKTAFDAGSMPSWREITRLICNKLYPADEPRRRGALADAFNTSGFLVMLMRMGLVADDADFAAHAAVGLFEWLRAATDSSSQLQPPPDDLIREIGVTSLRVGKECSIKHCKLRIGYLTRGPHHRRIRSGISWYRG